MAVAGRSPANEGYVLHALAPPVWRRLGRARAIPHHHVTFPGAFFQECVCCGTYHFPKCPCVVALYKPFDAPRIHSLAHIYQSLSSRPDPRPSQPREFRIPGASLHPSWFLANIEINTTDGCASTHGIDRSSTPKVTLRRSAVSTQCLGGSSVTLKRPFPFGLVLLAGRFLRNSHVSLLSNGARCPHLHGNHQYYHLAALLCISLHSPRIRHWWSQSLMFDFGAGKVKHTPLFVPLLVVALDEVQ